MKLGNYLSSEGKWEKIITILAYKRDWYFDSGYLGRTSLGAMIKVVSRCGFCLDASDDCKKCLLYPRFCADTVFRTPPLFWQICTALVSKRRLRALNLSKKMLAEIKKHDPRKEKP